jgi:hypothetical protein
VGLQDDVALLEFQAIYALEYLAEQVNLAFSTAALHERFRHTALSQATLLQHLEHEGQVLGLS